MSTRYANRANKDLKIHDIHTPLDPAATAYFSMCPPKSKVTRANKDLKNHDLHIPDPAATADFSMCPPKSKQQIEEEEEDDDFSDSSLSDAHREEYPIAATESEDSDSVSEGNDRTTTQSVIYPNKRKKGETNTRSEERKKDCEADEPSAFQTKSNLLYKYVPWCSKSSVDTQGKESWIDSWSSEHGKEPEEGSKRVSLSKHIRFLQEGHRSWGIRCYFA
ncbi:hypothetical protein MKW98_024015 [Papaver atlanticum]|uniref:Uncharacterized protein n=1 Tax=Papaver atlanticum TaxID=357466 RepID=A0AAD4XMV4_9MAGN|nr:hypothetical protein MKW98_024015 [Papaver atlanticum]